jgi:addiction module HigA family antidote
MTEILHRDDLHRVGWSDVATSDRVGPVLPGEVLLEEFMKPLGLSARAVARDIGTPPNLVTGILHGERSITARTALLLASRFGTSAEFSG